MNTRAKGQRTFQKAMRYALGFPGAVVIPIYQVSRFAQPQPFDLILLRPMQPLVLVEVRSSQWGVAKASTRQLARLPGQGYRKQLWRFRPRTTQPDIRQWSGWRWEGMALLPEKVFQASKRDGQVPLGGPQSHRMASKRGDHPQKREGRIRVRGEAP